MRIGTMAIMVDAMPVEVCCTAKRESETPRNGPKNEPMRMLLIPVLFRTAFLIFDVLRSNSTIIPKPIIPVMILIWVAAKAS